MQKPDASGVAVRGKVRTLIVDDCADIAERLRQLLDTIPQIETVGYAGNGEEALRLSARLQPDLVIMDIQMPVMNGIDAAHELRVCSPQSRIVLTSAFGPDAVFRFPGIGEMEFVPKAKLWRALPLLIEQMLGEGI